ncbi:transcription elongation protein SprT [Krasilnikovia sp. MM14-A1259]|uniref:transcription elongation protein SprT n=1 Tax=Krasilnikovia sp. MM14-A1259 TaxID=3373539 RepID=UPI00399C809D
MTADAATTTDADLAAAGGSAPETHETREAWLLSAVEKLTPLFDEVGATVPTVKVSVGWPGGRGKKNTVIGQCWASHASADKVAQLFISPVLDDAEAVLATLTHEVVHAVDDCKSGHKGNFARIAKGVGLAGKMTATVAGEALKPRLAQIAAQLGAYPHARLAHPTNTAKGEKTQTTRMIKVLCTACGYSARTTRKWLDEVGAPLCPCNREEMEIA